MRLTRQEDKFRLDFAEPRIIVQVRAEQQTCLIVMPSAADNLEEEEEDEVNRRQAESRSQAPFELCRGAKEEDEVNYFIFIQKNNLL